MERELKIGQHLVFIDEHRRERDALLICIHGEPKGSKYRLEGESEDRIDWPCVNLVVVCYEEDAQDQYGRQTTKEPSSVVHWANSSANGYCWRFADEEMTGSAAPSIS